MSPKVFFFLSEGRKENNKTLNSVTIKLKAWLQYLNHLCILFHIDIFNPKINADDFKIA